MKYANRAKARALALSLPVRGAWIEIVSIRAH